MGIYRQVAATFWTDTKVADEFNAEEKYLMLYLLTNPYTNLCGCYEISYRQISNDTGLPKAKLEAIMARLSEEHNVIRYSKDTKEILILNWYKYNWTSSEKFRKPLLSFISAIKNKAFKEYLMDLYNNAEEEEVRIPEYGIDTVSDEGRYPIDTSVSVSVSDTVSDTVSAKKPKQKTHLTLDDEVTQIHESDLPEPVQEKLIEWVTHKSEKHDKYTATGFKTLLSKVKKEMDDLGPDAVMDVIDVCMSNGYSGIIWEKANRKTRAAPASAPMGSYDPDLQRQAEENFKRMMERRNAVRSG